MDDKPLFQVVTALIVDDQHRILVQKRPLSKMYGGYWETPGGKVEAGETPMEALARELKEELGFSSIQIVERPLFTIGYSKPVAVCDYDVTLYRVLIPKVCAPQALENQPDIEFCSLSKMKYPRVPSLNTIVCALDTIYPLIHLA